MVPSRPITLPVALARPYQPEIVAAREATSPASLVERARHEVAHAVVAVALGGVVLECTTMETQVSGGHVTFVVPVGTSIVPCGSILSPASQDSGRSAVTIRVA